MLRKVLSSGLVLFQDAKLHRLKKFFAKNHVIVFECDDWGFCGWCRDKKVQDLLRLSDLNDLYAGDTLETQDDLERLFDVLLSTRDSVGRNAVFTAYFVMSNPDFEKIEESGFLNYRAQPIDSGFPDKWNNRGDLLSSWKAGIRKKVFLPEYHGMSHFFDSSWLEGLRKDYPIWRKYFDEQMIFPIFSEYGLMGTNVFLSLNEQRRRISEGFEIFRRTFGYYPRVVTCPNDFYNLDTVLALSSKRAPFLQHGLTPKILVSPLYDMSIRSHGIFACLFRNLKFEIGDSLDIKSKVENAIGWTSFLWKHNLPVIIDTHRANYVGGVRGSVAEDSRRGLARYLKEIQHDENLAFLTSYELFQICRRGYSIMNYGNDIVLRNFGSEAIEVKVQSLAKKDPAVSIVKLSGNDTVVLSSI